MTMNNSSSKNKQTTKPAAKTPAPATANTKPAAASKPPIGAVKAKPKPIKFDRFPKEMVAEFTTPPGRAVWPVLPPSPPDTKFSKNGGDYRMKIVLTPDEADPIIDICRELLAKAVAHFKKETGVEPPKLCESLPYFAETVEEKGEDGEKRQVETGNIVLSFKAPAFGKSPKTGEVYPISLPVVDAKGNVVRKAVGGGSRVRVFAVVRPFWQTAEIGLGISFRMKAVRVLELQQWSGVDLTVAFGGEEEGYVEDDGPGDAGPAPVGDAAEAGGDAADM